MNIKKILIPIAISVALGYICGSVVYEVYKNKMDYVINQNRIFLLQSGAYSSLDSMKEKNNNLSYIYFKEDDLYKVIVGITKDENNIEKIKNLYNENALIVKEYNLNNDTINIELKKYDEKLKTETDISKIKDIVLEMLELYKNTRNVTISQS